MARSRSVEDRALVLRRYPYGESSLVVHLLTPGSGKVHLVVKGAYRPRSAFSGVFDLFDTLYIRWRQPAHSELGTAAAGRVLVRRRALTEDLARYRAAHAVLELADLASQGGREEADLFRLVETWLDVLGRPRVDPGVALVAFDLRFLQNLGLSPSLSACAACGGAASPTGARRARGAPSTQVHFSAGAGGRLCARCGEEARASGRRVGTVNVNILRIAQSLQDAVPEHLARFQVNAGALRDVHALVQRFLDYHLEVRPRSRALQTPTA